MESLDKSAVEKSKKLLGVSEEISKKDLYDKLYEYRNSQHPDKFQDTEVKKKAEENFKEAGSLLVLLKKEIEWQMVSGNPNEIVPYQVYNSIVLKQESVVFQDEIRELKLKLGSKEYENSELKKELRSLRLDKLVEKKEELKQQYAPSKKGRFSNGIIFILALTASIFTRIEEIARFIAKYSPIPENIFNYILFGILILIPIRFLYMYLRQMMITNIAQWIVTPPMIQLFLDELKKENKTDNFSENNVYSFIQRIKFPRNDVGRFLCNKILVVRSHNVMNSLKDIFIYNLLSKQLIEISRADNLDRNFKIVKDYYHFSLNNEDLSF